jgi:hypothetical protein
VFVGAYGPPLVSYSMWRRGAPAGLTS